MIGRKPFLRVGPDVGWLAAQVRPFLRLQIVSHCCVTLAGIVALVDPLIMKWLIDDVLTERRTGQLPLVAAAFIAAYSLRRALDYAGTITGLRAIQRMQLRIRLALLRKLHGLSAEYHDERPLGDTLHRLEHDVAQIGTIGADILPAILRTITLACCVLAVMFVLNWRLTLLVLPLVPAFVIVRGRFRARLREATERSQAHGAAVLGFTQEALGAVVQVQLLGRERTQLRSYARLGAQAVRAEIARRGAELFFGSLLYLLIVAAMAGVLAFGGAQVLAGALTTGGLVAFYGYTLQLFIPLYAVVDVYARLQRVSVSISRVREVIEASDPVANRPDAVDLTADGPLDVEARGVSFHYRERQPVLLQVSFHIAAGETVAITGASGSGKSTLAKLAARLYDVRDGALEIGGRDVRDVTIESLRHVVTYVPQDPILFDTSLVENMRLGNPSATDADLAAVAELTKLDEVVLRLPLGWNEPLGARGAKLSGGERQRVALARAMLRRPGLLVLDEATSALDAQTERAVLAGLVNWARGTTLLLISHRAATLAWVDRVIEVRQGEVVEMAGFRGRRAHG